MAVLPMICVPRVSATSELLCAVFDWRSTHGGEEFDELVDANDVPAIWLHQLNAPEHRRFDNNCVEPLGAGVGFYVFSENIELTLARVQHRGLAIIEALALNPNADFREFTFSLPGGYQFSVAESPPGRAVMNTTAFKRKV